MQGRWAFWLARCSCLILVGCQYTETSCWDPAGAALRRIMPAPDVACVSRSTTISAPVVRQVP
jgi:hypothetical protein